MANDIPQYPMMFSPDQWANKYSPFSSGIQVPGWPTQYQGVPTDALGNPIQSYLDTQKAHDAWAAANPAMPPSTTLNTTPNAQWGLNNQMYAALMAQNQRGAQVYGGGGNAGMGLGDLDPMMQANNRAYGVPQQGMGGYEASRIYARNQAHGTGTPGGGAAPQNPYDMNAAYLAALSNPGKVTTPGATVPQAPTPTGQSGVLQQFLAGWKPGANPAGNYNPNLFTNALRGQV